MNTLIKISRAIVLGTVILWVLPKIFFTRVKPGEIAVRQSAASGVHEEDLGPGMRMRIWGLHKYIFLPSGYFFLDYGEGTDVGPVQIRTKDNNTVIIDVTVPVRIKKGEAHKIVKDGNHARDGARFRYQRLAGENAVSTLREKLANLAPAEWYSTEKRLAVNATALEALNEALSPLHLEAQAILIRSIRFTDAFEQQLTQIQLNQQRQLLNHTRQQVAARQQELDNYVQDTAAQAAAKEQDWIKRQAELERNYQLGMLGSEDASPGAARAKLEAMTEEQRLALRTEAAKVFDLGSPELATDAYLIGINNIQAETLKYRNDVRAVADGTSARLEAEGEALVARVQGEYETKLNALLSSPAGRAYVAYNAAANVTFAQTLTFSSQDGIPSVLRLRRFAEQFMGGP
jgi:hypothetical protein